MNEPNGAPAGPRPRRILLLIGAVASGKGTQAEALSAHLEIPHLASGDLARSDFTVLVPFDAIDSVPIVRMLLLYFYCDPIGQTEQHETGIGTFD